MNVTKFSLINNGYIGIRVSAVEAVEQGNVTMLDHVIRERRYQISAELRKKINSLKYFYLNLTNHWIEPFNKYFDLNKYEIIEQDPKKERLGAYDLLVSLMNHTNITGMSTKNAGFCISGTIDITDDKKIAVTTPFITEEDDVSFFMEAQDRITGVLENIAKEMTSPVAAKLDAREIAKALKMYDSSKLEDKELEDNVIDKLQAKGFFVMKDDNPEPPEVRVHTGTGSIDSHKLPQNEEVKEEKETMSVKMEIIDMSASIEVPKEEKKIDKKDIGKGTLASEKGFPILDDVPVYIQKQHEKDIPAGGSLEALEYSENMGIPRDEPKISDINQGEW